MTDRHCFAVPLRKRMFIASSWAKWDNNDAKTEASYANNMSAILFEKNVGFALLSGPCADERPVFCLTDES